ncbi:DUF1194 domain-containing protein [Azospirillum formosense]|uniref:DUF1194 domain-containing protein n=1 Tax=Azospirillum formosense TaxID=861533 RepID=A0ABX2KMD7_9PROT|nr:DUF1194 domain-containing protein [Azospirillum formosense]MBY3753042.1 DUF1194 domain-containing protein [Azospirillum formosense]NUB17771.1 DUF1194 domain-containing protein [Azospirillum formosense]
MDGAWRLAGVAAAVLVAGGLGTPAFADTPVDLELVLAVDVSGSVDAEEGRLQREGYVAALTDPKVQAAIRGGPFGRIAVTYVEWAGDSFQRITVPWTLLSDHGSAEAFASSLAESPTLSAQWTSISAAIDFSVRLFNDNGFEGTRRVIDVSGDGINNRGRPVQWARDEAVAAGITINGLPILNDRPNPWGGAAPTNLDGYYEEHVIGGPGAFLVPAVSFEAFADAILSKLLLEISGLPPDPGGGSPTGLASR